MSIQFENLHLAADDDFDEPRILKQSGRLVGFTTDSDEGYAYARLFAAAPELLSALKALKLECLADVLNPCWDNRPSDVPGLHWGSEPGAPVTACSSCIAKAAIAKAEGR